MRIKRTWDDRISEDFLQHIVENINLSENTISQGIPGRVNVSFDVDSENNITNVGINSTNALLDSEIKAVFQSAPKINNDEMTLIYMFELIIVGGARPAELANIRRFTLPINFVISEID